MTGRHRVVHNQHARERFPAESVYAPLGRLHGAFALVYLFEGGSSARLPVEIDVASEHRFREAPVDRSGLTIGISQSGETADTLASLRHVKDNGSKTVGAVNVPTSRTGLRLHVGFHLANLPS